MTIKELKEKIQNLPDDAEVIIDYAFLGGELGWSSWEQEEETAKEASFHKWAKEFHISTYTKE